MMIADYLKRQKKTQRQFADEIGCTTAFINSLINGKNTDIKISLVRKISEKTKLPESKLITELLSFKREAAGAGVSKQSK